jgi:hypothetical protein
VARVLAGIPDFFDACFCHGAANALVSSSLPPILGANPHLNFGHDA